MTLLPDEIHYIIAMPIQQYINSGYSSPPFQPRTLGPCQKHDITTKSMLNMCIEECVVFEEEKKHAGLWHRIFSKDFNQFCVTYDTYMAVVCTKWLDSDIHVHVS